MVAMNFDNTKEKQLIAIDKTELRNFWHLVRPGLIAMQEEQESADQWVPEELYASCASGNATLMFCSISRQAGTVYKDGDAAVNDACGFVILQKTTNAATSNLHIWVAASNEHTNKNGAGSIMRNFNVELDLIAKNAGCSGITFNSNRTFWEKIAPKFGFEINEIRYRKEVK
jgi:hypothetical protein